MANDKRDTVCPPEPSVFVWTAAYFGPSSKKWEHGEIQVTPSTLCFYNVPTNPASVSTPEKQAKSLLQLIRLDNIAELKKASSSYVFKCVIVLMKSGEEHWFGSLPGRDGAYNALLHFWRERLLNKSSGGATSGGTKLGQELLAVAQDSSDTLKETGQTLKRQGEQLDYARSVMFDLHNDLDVAHNLTTNLESWFGHWGMTSPNLSIEPIELVDSKGIPAIHEFPILYHEGGGTNKAQQSQSLLTKVHLSPKRGPPIQELTGTLRLSSEGATILDADQKPICHYKTRDISAINVSSPWKLSIVKYCIGEPDVVYKVTSTQLTSILHVLHSVACDKIQYESPLGEPVIPHFVHDLGPVNITGNQLHELESTGHVNPLSAAAHPLPSNSEQSSVQVHSGASVQVHSEQEVVSREEVNELSDLVGGMKTMALSIQREEDKQLESIDALTESVDHANARLKSNTHRVNKLL